MRRGWRKEASGDAGRRAGLAILLALTGAAALPGCRRDRAPPLPTAGASAPAAPRVAAVPARYGLRPAEERAVEEFLRRHPELRFPDDADRRVSPAGEGDIRNLYGVYHPYFVRGDLNDDGVLDFVMGFVRRDSSAATPWFTVVVFSGREAEPGSAPTFGPEIFLERDITLSAGDISIDRDAIVITPDLEDEATRRYRWDPARGSYVFVRDGEPETGSPELSQT
ncbi:MAG: hypothetical protein ACRD3M_11795 [Thermoanaerobaculia bacterium]